ncbi:hypothetical protein RRG08_010267 [Elysia crispata]|uniref:Uncharacterized protein n=1 Tax=Elysia crispata TaxID=231223 RepID=A0AAE0Z293_9GAST|nr:hypothetical protein RRG08_010267 [Elysia crispata]
MKQICTSTRKGGMDIPRQSSRKRPLDYVYLPPPRNGVNELPPPGTMVAELEALGVKLEDADYKEIKEKYELVKAYEKALRNPKFMVQEIKARDCPIHDRWCSVIEKEAVDDFLVNYVTAARKDYPNVSPFDIYNELSVVFPTVETMDMFQMLNNRRSYKAEDLQWTGHSELYAKVWPELDIQSFLTALIMRVFLQRFDDMPGLFKLFNQLDEKYKEAAAATSLQMTVTTDDDNDAADPGTASEDKAQKKARKNRQRLQREMRTQQQKLLPTYGEIEKRYLDETATLKNAVFNSWYSRVEESAASLGDLRAIQKSMMTMFEYSQSFGMVPYEEVDKKTLRAAKKRNISDPDGTMAVPRCHIPDPYTILVMRNRRTNSYVCWNYRTNKEVKIALDPYGIPFDTKLVQLLKAEYTYAELLRKQNGTHLSDGYILVEKKDEVDTEEVQNALDREAEAADRAAMDKAEEQLWKRQLEDFDRDIKYNESGPGGKPARIVLSGVQRPSRLPYLRGAAAAAAGSKASTKDKLKDPAEELLGSLKRKLTSGERELDNVNRLLRGITSTEDKHIKQAGKKLSDLVESRYEFVKKINKNLDSVTKEIQHISDNIDGESKNDGSFGIIPIRKMVSSMTASFNNVQELVEKLQQSMASVGIDPEATTETDMFREMDTRISAASSTAIQRAQMELRTVLTAVEKTLDHMETIVTNHTSALHPPTSTHERVGVDDVSFSMEYYDDDFSGIIRGANEVTPLDALSGGNNDRGNGRTDELYAEYYSRLKEANDMYVGLKKDYKALVKEFQASQVKTMKELSASAENKAKALDARKVTLLTQKLLAYQSKLNSEGVSKIEALLEKMEEKFESLQMQKEKKQFDMMQKLQSVQTDIQNVLALADSGTADMSNDALEEAVVQSDAVLAQLREDRMAELEKVAEIYREDIKQLQSIIPPMEERVDRRREELKAIILKDLIDTPASGSDEAGSGADAMSMTANEKKTADNIAESIKNTHKFNKKAYETYGTAIEEYRKMLDQVAEEREKILEKARKDDVDRKYKADAARVQREAAIKEHNHMRFLKRYSSIVRSKDDAKRRKLCNGNHNADALTVGRSTPKPQMLVVKDHFRKANIMPTIPERLMKDTHSAIRERWVDFVDNAFPSVTAVDNHGVKTWTTNMDAVMNAVVAPFLKLQYGLIVDGRGFGGTGPMSTTNVKAAFYELCNEFVTDLLLNASSGDYMHLMSVFKPAVDHVAQSVGVVGGSAHGESSASGHVGSR